LDQLKLHIEGHVLIKDPDSGEILLSRRNAIHIENMSYAIASVLTNTTNINSGLAGFIDILSFGNGGVVVDGNGSITYNTTNVSDVTDELYNSSYTKAVNFTKEADADNNTTVVHTGGTTYSDIVVTCTLDYGEPVGQDPYDDTASQEDAFVFDEIGLVSQQGRLLTHLIFHPIQKSANRKIQVIYTVRITAG
jgi:hypothetical protein